MLWLVFNNNIKKAYRMFVAKSFKLNDLSFDDILNLLRIYDSTYINNHRVEFENLIIIKKMIKVMEENDLKIFPDIYDCYYNSRIQYCCSNFLRMCQSTFRERIEDNDQNDLLNKYFNHYLKYGYKFTEFRKKSTKRILFTLFFSDIIITQIIMESIAKDKNGIYKNNTNWQINNTGRNRW